MNESTNTDSNEKVYTEQERIAAIREAKRKERNRFAWVIALLS